ncbi:MAG: peptidoglycan DD-metalloendopeptidase family protein [Motiliproteus sp.]
MLQHYRSTIRSNYWCRSLIAVVSGRICFPIIIVILLSQLLLGCGGGSYAPVSDRSLGNRSNAPASNPVRKPVATSRLYYRVQKGDTLYSIAFRYGKDFSALARANGIGSDYRIFPGQRLKLIEAARPSSISSNRKTNVIKTSPKPVATSSTIKRNSSSKNSVKLSAGKVVWGWPAQGKILQAYRSKGKVNKGLNISAKLGDTVSAAAAGQVVYAGSGLLGYGNLIIINHNQQFLSAYAHNSKIYVKEHDKVKRGEKIAEAGNSGATRTMLHFEIRKDGKPVNPLNYLPKIK